MNRIRTGWLPVVALGAMAACLRIVGQTTAADLVGISYLIVATIAFGRPTFVAVSASTSYGPARPHRVS